MEINYFDPLAVANDLREKLMLNGKYLIARIADAGQDPGEQKVLDEFFRYKDYIHNPSWFLDSIKGRWSSRYLGFKDGWENMPLGESMKIEFQNPPYSAAYSLGGDPKDYSKVFTVQLAGCDYDCNYCFVPKKLNVGDAALGRYFSAAEIIEIFLAIKLKSETPMNVIRVSGGNPTIVPEIILDVFRNIREKGLNIYLWIDTNLSTSIFMEALGDDFKAMMRQKNVGFVGCFKGVSESDFGMITGADPKFYSRQFETARWLVDNGADFYAYLPALVYGGDVENKLALFANRLAGIRKNLPLRVEMLAIVDFPGAVLNYERAARLGRPMPEIDQKTLFNIWHNKILPAMYGLADRQKFSCQIFLN